MHTTGEENDKSPVGAVHLADTVASLEAVSGFVLMVHSSKILVIAHIHIGLQRT